MGTWYGSSDGLGRELIVSDANDGSVQRFQLGWCGKTSCFEDEQLSITTNTVVAETVVTARVSSVRIATNNGGFVPVGFGPTLHVKAGNSLTLTLPADTSGILRETLPNGGILLFCKNDRDTRCLS